MILEWLSHYQLNLMMILSSICGTLAFFVLITKTLDKRKKVSLLGVELGCMVLLMADRYAYVYRGNETKLGYWMVRVSNFLVFFMSYVILSFFNMYLKNLYKTDAKAEKMPRRLHVVDGMIACGMGVVILSQFSSFYYTFNSHNEYERGEGFMFCFLLPLMIMILQASAVFRMGAFVSRAIKQSLFLFTGVPLLAAVVQYFAYGLSLINISIVGMAVLLYVYTILDTNEAMERAKNIEIKVLKEEQKDMQLIFEQTAEALAGAIDAKDQYTHGHSRRVAEYSKKIAQTCGKSEKECDEIYFAALLHDVGKIGIPDEIINKEGKLTAEEFAQIKRHPVIGKKILSSIQKLPYLSIGANYHHERYDGKGYPEGLKGEDIPAIARIIAVADAYDAMTSKRSYREPLPQQKVREEFVKGLETQFDPVYGKEMLHLIDLDSEYEMKERVEMNDLSGRNQVECEEYKSQVSEGIWITPFPVTIKLRCQVKDADLEKGVTCLPSILLFDSLDGRTHVEEQKREEMIYFEYGQIRFDGFMETLGARRMVMNRSKDPKNHSERKHVEEHVTEMRYEIRAVKFEDHLRMEIRGGEERLEVTVALPDSARYAYVGLTGEHCRLVIDEVKKSEQSIQEEDIPRIAEKITYIDGPEGDVPNVQVNGWRTAATQGIPVNGKMKLAFHGMSLPTARLVWHCPFVCIYSADDGKIEGKNYRELALIRLDGECWSDDPTAENRLSVSKTDEFDGWDKWKELYKKGVDCEMSLQRKGNQIKVSLEACGISMRNTCIFEESIQDVYVAFTGDQVALTNVRVVK